jgi:hypothetical protein
MQVSLLPGAYAAQPGGKLLSARLRALQCA